MYKILLVAYFPETMIHVIRACERNRIGAETRGTGTEGGEQTKLAAQISLNGDAHATQPS